MTKTFLTGSCGMSLKCQRVQKLRWSHSAVGLAPALVFVWVGLIVSFDWPAGIASQLSCRVVGRKQPASVMNVTIGPVRPI
uniref:Uncharacterized protein n=1 Tax=Cynoglossus semilaevis TaxID=244447 RepID=A0A3P8X4G6_CYNSE